MKNTFKTIIYRPIKYSLTILLCINCVDNKSIGTKPIDKNESEFRNTEDSAIENSDQNTANLNSSELSNNTTSLSCDSTYDSFKKNLEENKITKEDIIKKWNSAVDKILNLDNISENNNALIDAKKYIELILTTRPDDIDKTMLEEILLKTLTINEDENLKSSELEQLIIGKIDNATINTLFNDAIEMNEEGKIKSANLAEYLLKIYRNSIDRNSTNKAFIHAKILNDKWNVRYGKIANLILAEWRRDGVDK